VIKNVRHTGIVVTDLEEALRFYGDLLGFTVRKRMDESGPYIDNMLGLKDVRVTTVKMASPDGQLIELLWFRSHPAPRPASGREASAIGVSHIALTVPDLESAYDRLLKAGIAFNAPPQLSPDGYAKVTFCRDPDGSLVELVEVLQ
jgi:catechol 2,3-dioxygenase-like lactoylglutathione lyase family enzyme